MDVAVLLQDAGLRVARDYTSLGSYAFLPLYALILWFWNSKVAWRYVGSGVTAGCVAATMKAIIQRPRPGMDSSVFVDSAFPSGHATMSFVTAFWFAQAFPRQRYWFYGGAVLIAATRLVLGVHYLSDVLAGVVLGLGVGLLSERFFVWIEQRGG